MTATFPGNSVHVATENTGLTEARGFRVLYKRHPTAGRTYLLCRKGLSANETANGPRYEMARRYSRGSRL